jgi:hypothetical protein
LLGTATDADNPVLYSGFTPTSKVQNIYTGTAKYLINRDCLLQNLYTTKVAFSRALNDMWSYVPNWSDFKTRTIFDNATHIASYGAAGTSQVEINRLVEDDNLES